MTKDEIAARLAYFDETMALDIGRLKDELRAIPDNLPAHATDDERERCRAEIDAAIERADRRMATARAKIAAGLRANALDN